MTPLHLAAAGGRFKIVEYLIEQGAKIDIQDPIGVNMCTTECSYWRRQV